MQDRRCDGPDERPSLQRDEGSTLRLARLHHGHHELVSVQPPQPSHGFVASDLLAVQRVLERIVKERLLAGPVFCELGSGLGGATLLAAEIGLAAHGIEIQAELVESARSLARDCGLTARFAQGSFLLPGDEDLLPGAGHTCAQTHGDAWGQLGLTPAACHVVFAYPWPGEEHLFDDLMLRHAGADALLVTFHDQDRVLVQRRVPGEAELVPLGWM